MVRWLIWHCPPDTGFEIRALTVWGRARYLSVTEAPHNTDFHTWMGKKHFCFFQTAETGNRTPNSGVKGSGAPHYPRALAPILIRTLRTPSLGMHFMQLLALRQFLRVFCHPKLCVRTPSIVVFGYGSLNTRVRGGQFSRWPNTCVTLGKILLQVTRPAGGENNRQLLKLSRVCDHE